MFNTKKLILKDEVDNIIFKCSNEKCGCTNFILNIYHINEYGELGCPMCFTRDIRVVFLNHRKGKRG